jgi:hypothetical protein
VVFAAALLMTLGMLNVIDGIAIAPRLRPA